METHWRYKNLWVIRESMCEANSWQTRGRQKNGPQSCFSAVGIEKKKDWTRTFHEEDLLFTFWVSEEKWPNFLYNCLNHNDLSLQFSTPGTLFKSMSVIAYKILITNKRPRKSLLLQDCVDWSGAPVYLRRSNERKGRMEFPLESLGFYKHEFPGSFWLAWHFSKQIVSLWNECLK